MSKRTRSSSYSDADDYCDEDEVMSPLFPSPQRRRVVELEPVVKDEQYYELLGMEMQKFAEELEKEKEKEKKSAAAVENGEIEKEGKDGEKWKEEDGQGKKEDQVDGEKGCTGSDS